MTLTPSGDVCYDMSIDEVILDANEKILESIGCKMHRIAASNDSFGINFINGILVKNYFFTGRASARYSFIADRFKREYELASPGVQVVFVGDEEARISAVMSRLHGGLRCMTST